jgi:hypothetical protein
VAHGSQLEKILDSRHDESMRAQAKLLAQLSLDQKGTNDQVAQLQMQTAADSKMLNSLTVLATLYLPINLVLVS